MATKKGLGIKIGIEEIDNGYTISLFTERGKSTYDKTVFCQTFEEISEIINTWEKKVKS